ncbi:MAG: hypothetical protein ACD_11C00057G0008 [uncultured bacterium]|nr:MAG: hypothetical protein ACD_11C00057G0008 [uncultured bacterium]HBR71795.1 hypothetical protein [Candidatus Moranbacteria bacterium]
MKFEQSIQNNASNKKEVLDEDWYEKFSELGSFQEFEYFMDKKEKREEQKNEFLGEQVRNPKLNYPKLENFDFESKERALLNLKKEILEIEKNEIVKQLYRWKINEKLSQLRMMLASKNGNDKRFAKYSRFIYGSPDENVFKLNLKNVNNVIERNRDSDDVRILFAIRRLESSLKLGATEGIDEENNLLPGRKRILLYPFREEKKFDSNTIAQEFEVALKEIEAEGWRVVIDDDVANIFVSHEKKQVNIPTDKKLTESNLKGLIAHEIKTHIYRREKGERSKLKLLELGLDRYMKGEEGISTYEEQKELGTDDFSGFDGHFAISLTMGIDGKKRDFREVFNILRDYFFLNSKEKNKQIAWEKAKDSAWARCVRTFRGTSCQNAGVCLTRDIVYREGNIGVWNLVKEGSGEARRFFVGKYDPTNSRHILILDQLGITDEDLETLEK